MQCNCNVINRRKFGFNYNHMSIDSQNEENSLKQPNNGIIKGRNGGTLRAIQKGDTTITSAGGKARLGCNNRSTIFNNWLRFATTGEDPNGIVANMSIQDKIVLAQVKKAIDGDTAAAIFLFDGAYGKVKDVVQQSGPQQSIDYSKFSPEELEVMDKAQRIMASKMNELRNGSVQDAEIVE